MSPAPRMSGSPTAVRVASHSSPGLSCRPLPASHSVFGSAPIPTTTRSAGTRDPSVSSTASTRPSPCECGNARLQAQVDAVVAMQVGAPLAQMRAQRQHRRRRDVDQRHVEALLARGLGDLATDEARAHDDDPRAPLERGPQRDRVVEAAQDVDALQFAAGAGPASRPGPRRHDQPVVRNLVAVGEHNPPAGAIQLRRRHAQAPLRVKRVGGEEHALRLGARRPARPSTAAAACTAGGVRRPPRPDLRRTLRLAHPAPPAARRAMLQQ